MSDLRMPANLGPTLCQALGLDAATVSRIVITLAPGQVTTVEVNRVVARGEDGSVVEAVSKYEMVEVGDDVSS